MFLPNNGKVAVFDDKQKDIEGLLKALSKSKIPFLYYQDEGGEDLPESPVENIRLIFLDLELVTNNQDKHNIISPIAGRLKSVVTKNNLYILIYWSTKEDVYRETLEQAFDDGLKDYKPMVILSLNKAEAMASKDPVDYVTKELEVKVKDVSSINAFMLWESAVNDASGRITNEMSSFVNKKNWDKGMYGLLHKLSKAQAGLHALEDQDNNSRLNLAFEVINNSLVETSERIFNELVPKVNLSDIKEGGRALSTEEKNKLNTKLHILSSENLQHFYSGNLYVEPLNSVGREIISSNYPKEVYRKFENNITKLVCLDITPSCDYAQRKYYTRILFGVLVEGKYGSSVLRGDSKYSEIPKIEIDGEIQLLFDYRTFRSYTREEFLWRFKTNPKYRLRNNILLDIQAQLSNHINRPGIVKIE
jgi:hypothetical protein